MAELLCVGTHATDDPTKAAFPFITATGALANQNGVAIALLGEAAYLMKDEIAKTVHPVGFPPFSDLLKQIIEGGVPIYV